MAGFGGSGVAEIIKVIPRLIGEGAQVVRDNIPNLEDEVTVEVVGQPGSNKQQLYFLALAAANGMVSRMGASLLSVAGSYGMLMIEYDGANDWVRCTIRYKWGMLGEAVDAPNTPLPPGFEPGLRFGDRFSLNRLAVYRGPQCGVVGGKFDFTGEGAVSGLPGIPNSSTVVEGAPQLPFANQPILTSCPKTPEPNPQPITQSPATSPIIQPALAYIPSPNPKPPGDNRSRGNIPLAGPSQYQTPGKCCDELEGLIPMVIAALSAPATDSKMTFTPPNLGPKGG